MARRKKTHAVAFSGIASAMCVLLLYFGSVIDVLDYTTAVQADLAEFILNNFYSVVNSTETAEHDHTEEEHEHETVYVFESLNKDDAGNEFKNGDKTLATLVGELVELYKTHTD